MKVSELSGAELDYWVAKAEGIGHPRAMREMAPGFTMVPYVSYDEEGMVTRYRAFEPSANWAEGGPIIERERMCVACVEQTDPTDHELWSGSVWPDDRSGICQWAKTPLEAAMRCFVESKFGDEVPD